MNAPSTSLQVFQFDNVATGASLSLNALEKDGQVWFVANDVCKALGIHPTSTRRLEEDEKGLHKTQTLGGLQQVVIINESGLYSLIFSSNKEQARAFRRWVTSQVIPSIRKHGGYINGQEALGAEDQQATLQVIQQEAERARAKHYEDKEARSDALRFMGRTPSYGPGGNPRKKLKGAAR
ncbi:BRO-N domain-containing protein [Azonexus hydrophilus]|uniref:BRO-N domain-containing protein n=1 Tax=Azonexus hydrophilus TaxID=418702 RepID=UPI000688BE97|nr:BRO family protein [Azonexus hydrophilus]